MSADVADVQILSPPTVYVIVISFCAVHLPPNEAHSKSQPINYDLTPINSAPYKFNRHAKVIFAKSEI